MVDTSSTDAIDAESLDSPLFVPFVAEGQTPAGQGDPSGGGGSFDLPGLGLGDGIGSILSLLPRIGKDVLDVVNDVEHLDPHAIIKRFLKYAPHLGGLLDSMDKGFWQFITRNSIGLVYREYLEDGLGVDVEKFDAEAQSGVTTVDTMLGFALLMPMLAAGIESIGKIVLANRWPHGIHESLKKLPEEMGMTWAMGMQIDEAFKVAVGRSIEEGINKQKRGNRIEWPVLRSLFKQHVFDSISTESGHGIGGGGAASETKSGDKVIRELLENQGFPDEQIDWILKLADQAMPVGDIQQLFMREDIDNDKAKKKLQSLGFSDDDVKDLMTLYVDKAETAAGAQLRSVARSQFRSRIIDETTYRGYLTDTHFPAKMIKDDIAAITLEHTNGRIAESLAVIKSHWQHDHNDDGTAQTQLQMLGYTPQFAMDTIAAWKESPLPHIHGLSTSQILSYRASGLIDQSSAYDRLIANGVNPQDATFLSQHPRAKNGVTLRKLTPALVTQAYLDHVITDADLPGAYQKTGVDPDDVSKYVRIAQYKFAHHKPGDAVPLRFTQSEVREAFHWDIWDRTTAHDALVKLGYDDTQATVLLEITAHGKFTHEHAPSFATVQDAIAYLEAHGFIVNPPPDPRLAEAEGMVLGAGYTLEYPQEFTGHLPGIPPPPSTPPVVPPTLPVAAPVTPPAQ